jgi:acetyltransferase-like isoleucine patch superfamily enzyme
MPLGVSLLSFFRPASLKSNEGRSCPTSQVGENSFIHSRVQILGWNQVFIGKDCVISEDCWLNVSHRPNPECRIEIGDHSFLGRRNMITAGGVVSLGSYCLTGPDCRFLGADHDFESPFVPYMAAPVTHGGSIRLGANCWLGANVTILKGVKIGHGSVIGASSIVTRDIPPFSIAIGSPARVIKRYNFVLKQWTLGAELPPEVEAKLPDEATYLRELKLPWKVRDGLTIASGSDQGDLP